jgi:protein-S-isoprenylcysteine O-methyltransferase Ste14
MIKIGNFFFRFRTAVFPVLGLLVLVPSGPVLPNNRLAFALGLAVVIIGQALRALTIGRVYIKRGGLSRRVYAADLVSDGVFAHCRNPLYIGNLLMLAGFALAINSRVALYAGGAFFVFVYIAIVAAEENFLRGKFGRAYDAYCRDVPRWWILPRGFWGVVSAPDFHWRRLLVKEYGTFCNWTAGLPLALYLRRHAFGVGGCSFAWQPLDGVLLGSAAAAFAFWAVARGLKKTKTIVGD